MVTIQATIVSISHSPSKDVVILNCKVSEHFDFVEGQFMMLQVLINDKIVKRAYSIYSINQQLQDNQMISFCIKRKEGGLFSTWATNIASVGLKIEIIWPIGKFIDNRKSDRYLFISVGSWLSPCFSIYTSLLATGEYTKIVNLFGERYFANIPAEVLDGYSIQNDKIYNHVVLSKDNFDINALSSECKERSWGQGKYVQDRLWSALDFLDSKDITVFICGLPAMCDDMVVKLQEKGIARERLIIEKY